MSVDERIARVRLALEELKKGQLVILTDDADREHEGDLVGLAAFVKPETVNFALKEARGVLCVPMSADRAKTLALPQMVDDNTEKFATKFTVSVDHVKGTTGVSAFDRAHTIQALSNESVGPESFESPGHIFPLVADENGVLARTGHTEGAVDLAKLAAVPPVAYIIEILADDGRMAREKQLAEFASRHNLVQLSIADIVYYRKWLADLNLVEGARATLPSTFGNFEVTAYEGSKNEPDLFVQSQTRPTRFPLVRIHSECLTGDVFGSKRCECGPQLHLALKKIEEYGGALLYMRQEGRGIGLWNKLKTYVLQQNGYDTYEANRMLGHKPDERQYKKAAQMLKQAGLTEVALLTNNPDKVAALEKEGIVVKEQVPLVTGIEPENRFYLQTKKDKFHHLFKKEEIS
ncbi:3,4-dihydroxy-2-butanone-4-phosphate synthase [Fructobacillus sp. M2-14]|uniref:GTP cyclohydrolase-2 n=1 Tax=Fructobacillus broussonetiae TaxID=2713173 RepID=A0ABS5QYC1_9LACO|nr:3,4-dihydroxy-2-butanone-4-phosphate synthase [Fructobacillus broussonetiae]MBS9338145.1 3,4-dihydroxy-2-butanone-4-phosphate synthase [Fructobacillus broussonetiae]